MQLMQQAGKADVPDFLNRPKLLEVLLQNFCRTKAKAAKCKHKCKHPSTLLSVVVRDQSIKRIRICMMGRLCDSRRTFRD